MTDTTETKTVTSRTPSHFTATITVGTRIGPRTLSTALSRRRMASVIHSSRVMGWVWFSPSIFRPVATIVAIMQKACLRRTEVHAR